jgi:hypothetical protein
MYNFPIDYNSITTSRTPYILEAIFQALKELGIKEGQPFSSKQVMTMVESMIPGAPKGYMVQRLNVISRQRLSRVSRISHGVYMINKDAV